jgi:FixJ family two-component response regulator
MGVSVRSSLEVRDLPSTAVVVDPDHFARERCANWLAEVGYRVAAVPSFAAARDVLKHAAPTLLVVEVRLGAFNGLQLVVHAVNQHGTHPPACVVISDLEDPAIPREAERLGAAWLPKPYTRETLLTVISRVVRRPA